jgi:hypothetical protein
LDRGIVRSDGPEIGRYRMAGGRWFFLVTCVVILAVSAAAAGCGSASTTTTLGPSTTASMPTTTTSASAPTGGIPTKELQAYIDQMAAFAQAFSNSPATSFLKITDPSTATAADLQQADAASAFVHKLLDQLQAIKPPAVIAARHDQFVALFRSEVQNMDDFIAALKAKDAVKMRTAYDALTQEAGNVATMLTQLLQASGVK